MTERAITSFRSNYVCGKHIAMLTANIFIIICISLASSSFASGAKKDTVPSWLDTIAPRVEIAPKKLYQTTVFQIVLSANERSSLWIGLGSLKEMKLYSEPVSITTDGKYKIYYYAEDDFGNKSKIDSVIFVLDRKAPKLSISPQPGMYKKGTVLRISRDEECKVFVSKKDSDTTGLVLLDSLPLVTNIEGFLLAIDKAGNKSIAQKIKYTLDTTRIEIKVTPAEGAYNTPKKLTFSANEGVSVYYTFDPLAPPDWFSLYNTPVQIPHGANILRYFGRAKTGFESDISKRTYLLDTIPPKLTLKVEKGNQFDTIFLSSKEKATIWYTLNGETPGEKSFSYSTPIAIPQKGRCLFKAIARDDFGNFSEAIQWEYKYDKTPPVVTISSIGGAFTQPQTIFLSSNEDGTILYTLDRSLPDSNSIVYTKDGIVISKEDSTILRCIALDSAGNKSEEKVARFYLDTRAPAVRVKIEGTLETGAFNIHLIPNEISTIYYEIGDALPNRNSPIYKGPIPLITGQTLRYIAVDRAGNASEIGTMDELKRPMVAIVPEAGLYNKKLKVSFVANITGKIYWRLLPDTTFRPFLDSIQLDREGSHSIEYYVESASGLRSPFKRAEYFIDWTPPKTEITLRKGVQDSVSVLFTCSENASIYYTLDGSNPHVSATTKMGANKFSQSRDRISIIREQNVKLAFFAEDVSGNQSSLTVLDVFKPRAIPNVPAGSDRIYDRILSIELNTFSQSAVYYARHGKMPTTDSAVYTTPITLMESDTIIAFVVDASGFRGEADTFVYLIDLPPSPQFTEAPLHAITHSS